MCWDALLSGSSCRPSSSKSGRRHGFKPSVAQEDSEDLDARQAAVPERPPAFNFGQEYVIYDRSLQSYDLRSAAWSGPWSPHHEVPCPAWRAGASICVLSAVSAQLFSLSMSQVSGLSRLVAEQRVLRFCRGVLDSMEELA